MPATYPISHEPAGYAYGPMATISSTVWDVIRLAALLVAAAAILRWLVAWRRGDAPLRDDHGRLKPAPAAAAAVALVVVVGTVASVLTA